MAKFGAGDPYLQEPLERREIIEASHKAAIQMAEILGQDANYHSLGAQAGQHAAIPLPKADQGLVQPIKLFLANRETPATEDLDSTGMQISTEGQEQDEPYVDGQDGFIDTLGYEEEHEELITDILERRLAYLYMAFQPPEPVEGPADTLIIVRRSQTSDERVLIRAHSQVLKRTNDAFNELIGYRPPMVPTPSNLEEAEETGMQISWSKDDAYPPHRTSIYSNLMGDSKMEHENKYSQARRQSQLQQDTTTNMLEYDSQNTWDDSMQDMGYRQGERNMMSDEEEFIAQPDHLNEDVWAHDHVDKPASVAPNFPDRKKVSYTEELQMQEMNAKHLSTEVKKGQRRVTWAQDSQTKRMNLGLENVIGSLQDSLKPSLVNQFVDASLNLVQLPGWDHLPTDLKQSFEQFAASINKFKYPDLKPLREANAAKTEIDGKSLESEFLGMVGRGSKEMLSILHNIGHGIAERRASKILLDKVKLEDLEGKPGNAVSAKVPRTSFEKKESNIYREPKKKVKHDSSFTH